LPTFAGTSHTSFIRNPFSFVCCLFKLNTWMCACPMPHLMRTFVDLPSVCHNQCCSIFLLQMRMAARCSCWLCSTCKVQVLSYSLRRKGCAIREGS
jgi:hypothetical protein